MAPPAMPEPMPTATAEPISEPAHHESAHHEPMPSPVAASPAPAAPKPAAPKSVYDSLEQEMASLLGRPNKT
jgi:hypothetical protein